MEKSFYQIHDTRYKMIKYLDYMATINMKDNKTCINLVVNVIHWLWEKYLNIFDLLFSHFWVKCF